jgi:hypothetical protein
VACIVLATRGRPRPRCPRPPKMAASIIVWTGYWPLFDTRRPLLNFGVEPFQPQARHRPILERFLAALLSPLRGLAQEVGLCRTTIAGPITGLMSMRRFVA